MGTEKSLDKLRPEFRPIVKYLISEAEAAGVNLVVNETVRTDEVQRAYYAQGREPLGAVNALRRMAGLYELSAGEEKNIITNMPHVRTDKGHGAGLAVDFVPDGNWNAPKSKWAVIGKCVDKARVAFAAKLLTLNATLVWGGSWKGLVDTPHVEMIIGFK